MIILIVSLIITVWSLVYVVNQIKELIRERKALLDKKAQAIIMDQKLKLESISQARPEDLRVFLLRYVELSEDAGRSVH